MNHTPCPVASHPHTIVARRTTVVLLVAIDYIHLARLQARREVLLNDDLPTALEAESAGYPGCVAEVERELREVEAELLGGGV